MCHQVSSTYGLNLGTSSHKEALQNESWRRIDYVWPRRRDNGGMTISYRADDMKLIPEDEVLVVQR
jgi:hypothetical protein